jgi:flagellar basal-body rod protein FlgF
MPNSMYTAASGAMAQSQALDVLADNLANVQTVGFKASHLSFRDVLVAAQNGQTSTHVQVEAGPPQVDFSQGDLRTTGNALDVALLGDGFFVVQTPQGERLTRNGSFHVNAEGVLATQTNLPVMGEGGIIRLNGANARVDIQGSVWVGDAMVDRLQVATVDKPSSLVRQGDSMFRPTGRSQLIQLDTGVQSGVLESANARAVQLMTDLVWVQRAYEIYNRTIEVSRNVDQKIANGVA